MHLSRIIKNRCSNLDGNYILPIFNDQDEAFDQGITQQIKTADYNSYEQQAYGHIKKKEIIDSAEEIALKTIADAQKTIEDLHKQAKIDIQKMYKENYEKSFKKGFEEGRKQGYNDMLEKQKRTIDELQILSNSLVEEKKFLLQKNKGLTIDLASEIAQKVIGENFTKGKALLFTILEKLVENLEPADRLLITVSGEDYKILSFEADKLKSIAKQFTNVVIEKDNTAEEGTLILETAVMVIDASLNTQIERIKNKIACLA